MFKNAHLVFLVLLDSDLCPWVGSQFGLTQKGDLFVFSHFVVNLLLESEAWIRVYACAEWQALIHNLITNTSLMHNFFFRSRRKFRKILKSSYIIWFWWHFVWNNFIWFLTSYGHMKLYEHIATYEHMTAYLINFSINFFTWAYNLINIHHVTKYIVHFFLNTFFQLKSKSQHIGAKSLPKTTRSNQSLLLP